MITLTKEKSLIINNALRGLDSMAIENLSKLTVVYISTEM